MKLTSTLLGLVLTLSFVNAGFASQPSHDSDVAEFQTIAGEYMNAMNSYNVEAIVPRLANKLDLWMPLGIQIKSADEFRSYMKAMSNKIGIGKGGTYRIKTQPKATVRYFKGNDDAFVGGTMDEEVQVLGQTPKAYSSAWLIHLKKSQGAWKIVGGTLDADPAGQSFTVADINGWKGEIETAMKASGKSKGGK
ncbi:MAG: hypothetical protein HY925_16465 [Elusimicrobia bacterium]|nr:hypothetical protein [Elusimicrobiota bacterium]